MRIFCEVDSSLHTISVDPVQFQHMTLKWCHCHEEELMSFELQCSTMFVICRIDGEASPEAEQVQLNGEKEAETREGKTV
jgi:hypothetical protein